MVYLELEADVPESRQIVVTLPPEVPPEVVRQCRLSKANPRLSASLPVRRRRT